MAEQTFAEQMVAKLQTLMLKSVGMKAITLDGQTVQYDDLIKLYEFWSNKQAIESGTKRRINSVCTRPGDSF